MWLEVTVLMEATEAQPLLFTQEFLYLVKPLFTLNRMSNEPSRHFGSIVFLFFLTVFIAETIAVLCPVNEKQLLVTLRHLLICVLLEVLTP
jgi:hypothetical protein